MASELEVGSLNTTGNVSVNASAPKAALHVKNQGDNWEDGLLLEHDSGNTGWNIHPDNNTGNELFIGYNADTSVALTSQAATVALRLNSSGLATFSGGINLGDTNLSNYKEGTWTPVHAADASTTGTWNTTLAGVYTRVGDLVSVTMKITGTSMDFSSDDGYRGYTGLPFTPSEEGSAGSYATAHAAAMRGPAAVFSSGSAIYL